MITVTQDINNVIDTLSYTGYNSENCVFFDIETTGFSVKNTQVYLIGVVYYENSIWKSIQWFATNKADEKEILQRFFEFIRPYKVLIHFNGEGFDIPYLRQKAELLGVKSTFEHMISIDIFKAVSQFKKFLKLENYKQKTIEKFLDIKRNDKYSGGDLINIYTAYLKNHNCEFYEMLLLHNSDDIIGMTGLLPMLAYSRILDGAFEFESYTQTEDEIIFNCRLSFTIPKRVSLGHKDFYITAYGNNIKFRVKIYSEELKFFYKNYHDYYYLPAEDMAMHKSVAFYVDKDFRTKAKAANCYSRKTGTFIPQFSEIVSTYFKIDYHDKTMYIELTEDFLNDNQLLYSYLLDIIKAV